MEIKKEDSLTVSPAKGRNVHQVLVFYISVALVLVQKFQLHFSIFDQGVQVVLIGLQVCEICVHLGVLVRELVT